MSVEITGLLHQVARLRASDLHLTVGLPPLFRIDGRLESSEYPPLTAEDTASLAKQLLTEHQAAQLKDQGELDFSYSLPGAGRFRVNVYRQRGAFALALRLIPEKIPSLDSLGMPDAVAHLARRQKGLILVTGPTGCGKSTTLAAMINLINTERQCHILTLEDPIEFIHTHRNSMVNQREIGTDSGGFAQALRAAMRQDPDVILVGEMRDLETIATAITAAETGHLVMATLHTADAPQTIDRVIDVFPPHQQQQIRVQLSSTLQGIISQRLIPKKSGKGRVAAVEILVANTAVRNLIREGKTFQIYSVMQTGSRSGMQTMDSHLRRLCQEGTISLGEALQHAVDPDALARALQLGGILENRRD